MKLLIMAALMFWVGALYATEFPSDSEYNDSLKRAKELNAKLAQTSRIDLAKDLLAWNNYWAMLHTDTIEQVIAADITTTYTLTVLVNDTITKEESILLTTMFHRLPIYGEFEPNVELKEIAVIEELDIDTDMPKLIFSAKETDIYLNQSMKMKRHWLRARGLFKLALRR